MHTINHFIVFFLTNKWVEVLNNPVRSIARPHRGSRTWELPRSFEAKLVFIRSNMGALSSSSPLILRCILRRPPPPTTTHISYIAPFFKPSNRTPSICLPTPRRPIYHATIRSLTPRSLSTSTSPSPEIQPAISEEEGAESDDESEVEINDNHPTETAIEKPVDPKISSAHKEMLSKLKGMSVKEKKELGSYANSLGKKLKSQQVGKSGVTDSVATALVETLEANELLKVELYFEYFRIVVALTTCCYSG